VVHLVSTGPVPLGAYTLAEIAAVKGTIDFLEHEPSAEVLAEAVRSLSARHLMSIAAGDEHVQVRGDLGIALAFQQRSNVVIDARLTGSNPVEPWRLLLMPQPEGVALEVLIDALGIHLFALRTTDDALKRLMHWLPAGEAGPRDADLDAVLAESPHTALVTTTRWQRNGSRESSDLVLARDGDRLHAFLRDPHDASRFVAQALARDATRNLLAMLARADAPAPAGGSDEPHAYDAHFPVVA
jgi:hypothetical protein